LAEQAVPRLAGWPQHRWLGRQSI